MNFQLNKVTMNKLRTYLNSVNERSYITYVSDTHIAITYHHYMGEEYIQLFYKSPNFYKILSIYYTNLDDAIEQVKKILEKEEFIKNTLKTALDYFSDISNEDKKIIYQTLLNELESE